TSFFSNQNGEIALQAPSFKEDLYIAEFDRDPKLYKVVESAPALETFAEIYLGLVLESRDYVERSVFPGVILGLSGGIESALTLAIAVDAIGAE
ncbi:NAD+ synthase, partial [Acinetobacter baumannii]